MVATLRELQPSFLEKLYRKCIFHSVQWSFAVGRRSRPQRWRAVFSSDTDLVVSSHNSKSMIVLQACKYQRLELDNPPTMPLFPSPR